jgi:hypothetical protein
MAPYLRNGYIHSLGYNSEMLLRGSTKTTGNIGQDGKCRGLDWNRAPLDYALEEPPLVPALSMVSVAGHDTHTRSSTANVACLHGGCSTVNKIYIPLSWKLLQTLSYIRSSVNIIIRGILSADA